MGKPFSVFLMVARRIDSFVKSHRVVNLGKKSVVGLFDTAGHFQS